MSGRINFAGNWGGIHQVEYRRMASNEKTGPRFTRVHFAALGYANRIGHAEFGPGELAQVLGIGVGRAADKAVKQAKDAGLVGKDSGTRCLVLPHTMFQTGKGSAECHYHGASMNDVAKLRLDQS